METRTSKDIICSLLALHPDIDLVTLFEPPAAPSIQDRLKSNSVTSTLVASGLKIRSELGLPFWDSLLVSCFGVGAAAVPVVEKALFHNLSQGRTTPLLASSWSTSAVDDAIEKLAIGTMLVFSSRVKLQSGTCKHIPLLDFHVPTAPQNQELVVFIANSLDSRGGYILNSGKSYHFYGKSLLEEDQLPVFLGKALLFCPFIDRAWVAHQLIEGACGLRISQKPGGRSIPELVVEL